MESLVGWRQSLHAVRSTAGAMERGDEVNGPSTSLLEKMNVPSRHLSPVSIHPTLLESGIPWLDIESLAMLAVGSTRIVGWYREANDLVKAFLQESLVAIRIGHHHNGSCRLSSFQRAVNTAFV